MSLYGPIFHRGQLDHAVLNTLRTWAPAYLAAIAAQEHTALGSRPLPPIKSWAAVGRADEAPELEPPYVLVTSAGTSQDPEMDGDGIYAGWFAVAFTIEVEVNSPEQARANYVVGLYVAALRAALVQQGSLGGIASALRWVRESYEELGVSEPDQTARAAAGAAFLVRVDELVTAGAGPLTPPDPGVPPGDWPLVSDPIVHLQPQPIEPEEA